MKYTVIDGGSLYNVLAQVEEVVNADPTTTLISVTTRVVPTMGTEYIAILGTP